jgi:hypothetical protein
MPNPFLNPLTTTFTTPADRTDTMKVQLKTLSQQIHEVDIGDDQTVSPWRDMHTQNDATTPTRRRHRRRAPPGKSTPTAAPSHHLTNIPTCTTHIQPIQPTINTPLRIIITCGNALRINLVVCECAPLSSLTITTPLNTATVSVSFIDHTNTTQVKALKEICEKDLSLGTADTVRMIHKGKVSCATVSLFDCLITSRFPSPVVVVVLRCHCRVVFSRLKRRSLFIHRLYFLAFVVRIITHFAQHDPQITCSSSYKTHSQHKHTHTQHAHTRRFCKTTR